MAAFSFNSSHVNWLCSIDTTAWTFAPSVFFKVPTARHASTLLRPSSLYVAFTHPGSLTADILNLSGSGPGTTSPAHVRRGHAKNSCSLPGWRMRGLTIPTSMSPQPELHTHPLKCDLASPPSAPAPPLPNGSASQPSWATPDCDSPNDKSPGLNNEQKPPWKHSHLTRLQNQDVWSPPPLAAVALAAVALLFLPVLLLLRHAELAARGVTSILAAVTATCTAAAKRMLTVHAATFRPSRPHSSKGLGGLRATAADESTARVPRSNAGVHFAAGGVIRGKCNDVFPGYVLPLPYELNLQPIAVVLSILPLVLPLAAAVLAATLVDGVPGGSMPPTTAAKTAAGHVVSHLTSFWSSQSGVEFETLSRALPSAMWWLFSGLMYGAALLISSPGSIFPGSWRGVYQHSLLRVRFSCGLRVAVSQGFRWVLLLGSWIAVKAATAGSGLTGACMGGVWAVAVCTFWGFHTAGLINAVASVAS